MNETRPESYIGISGVVNQSQQEQLEVFADNAGIVNLRRRLVLGVKATHKTQFLDSSNKYGSEWYPVGQEQFESALSKRKIGSNVIGIAQAFFDLSQVGDKKYREDFSNRIFQRGDKWIDGIQFDMLPWHENPDMFDFLSGLKSKYHTKIFLQCHKKAMDMLGPNGVSEKLGHYSEAIDYVLFDSSHGTGTRLDTDKLRAFLEASHNNGLLNSVGFAIAGGLNEQVAREELPKILNEFPDISWDAEGQLHPATDTTARPLDMQLTERYLQASADVIKSV